MNAKKLTLSIAPEIIAKARRLSKHRRTSVSAMFSDYIKALNDTPQNEIDEIPPLTKRAMELTDNSVEVSNDWDYKEELTNVLLENYNIK